MYEAQNKYNASEKGKKVRKKYASKESSRINQRKAVSNWQKDNKEKTNEKQRRYYKNLKIKVLNIIGETCICCGVTEWWNLTLNHIIPIKGERCNSHDIYRAIINGSLNKNDFQTLCNGCNNSKSDNEKCQLIH